VGHDLTKKRFGTSNKPQEAREGFLSSPYSLHEMNESRGNCACGGFSGRRKAEHVVKKPPEYLLGRSIGHSRIMSSSFGSVSQTLANRVGAGYAGFAEEFENATVNS